MTENLFVPFSEKQIDSINQYQHCDSFHHLTCACGTDLVAEKNGLYCGNCLKIVQDWVPLFTADMRWYWFKEWADHAGEF
jgi:hypothetical protein